MSLISVSDLLCERIGLAPESLGATVLPRAVETRMQVLGLSTVDDYAARLIHDLEEFQTLVADLTVPETWFFRGGEIFAYLARHIAQATPHQTSGAKYRVLSVPCSSGEEPYSLAIALTEEGVPPASWMIEGVDIDPRLTERARQGRFGHLSFRETAPELRERYFRGSEETWELDAAIRSLVHFQEGNLLDPRFLAAEANFDLIFCRNLFIYLRPTARLRALAALDRLLAPQGLLCMGHAESLDSLNAGFVRTGPQPFLLYHRTPDRAGGGAASARCATVCQPWHGQETVPQRGETVPQRGETVPQRGETVPQRGETVPQRGETVPQRGETVPQRGETVPQRGETVPKRGTVQQRDVGDEGDPGAAHHSALTTHDAPDLLVQARQQADSGQIQQALATCQAHLQSAGPSAELFCLMGVLHQACQEKEEAAGRFRQALYLEPLHRESLMHLMLLCREFGDDAQATRLRHRLKRSAPVGDDA
jgi:chemotaxis protein methyltransferase WspC